VTGTVIFSSIFLDSSRKIANELLFSQLTIAVFVELLEALFDVIAPPSSRFASGFGAPNVWLFVRCCQYKQFPLENAGDQPEASRIHVMSSTIAST